MLLDPPASLVSELNNRWLAYQSAQTNQSNNPGSINTLILNTATKALNKTLDKCSVELGLPTVPRPTVAPQDDGTLKLQYPS